ncbi:MAG: hypothetical protein JSR45_12485 [Proteobacteria bacterium]|nr:hypothetical protein [Pseudomonadota bacterium]
MAAALAIHMLIFLAMLAGASGDQISIGTGQGMGDEETVNVSLAGLAGSLSSSRQSHTAAQRQDDQMDALFRKLTSAQTPNPLPAAAERRPNGSKLMDLFSPQPQDAPSSDAKPADDQRGDGGQGSDHGDGKGAAHAAQTKTAEIGRGDGAPSGGAFPSQVDRCWRALPGHSAVPVVLEVTLSGAGLIATPPRIVRPAGAVLDEKRLISEERAIRALASCVPYRGAMSGDQTFRLSFHAR